MARRRSLNRRWSRKSINDSAVLDQDSNYIDEEDDTFWRHLPDQTNYANRLSTNAPSEAFLNSNSRIIDDDDIEATEWWNHLQKTSQDLVEFKAIPRPSVSNSNSANVSNVTSHSDANSITEAIKKKRIMLGAKRKSSGKNPFSQALDSSDVAVESEPILALKRKDISQNLSRSVEEGVRRSKRSRISNKSRYSPDSNTSTDTEKRSRARSRPLLFRRPKRKSSYAFDKILLEDDSIVGPSQSLNVDKSKTLDDGNTVQENHEDTNKTKEFMTQPRSPFDKIRKSSRKSKSNIIIESQEDKDHQELSQNSKIHKTSQTSIENPMNDENDKISEDAAESMDTSMENRNKHSHIQNSDSDKNFKLRMSDGRISDDESDKSLPIRSHRSLRISSLSSSESEIIETRKSKRLSKQVNDNSSDQNNAKSIETIRHENKYKKSNSELSSTNQKLNPQRKQSSMFSSKNKTDQDNLSNETSSTESLFEVQKSGRRNSEIQQLNSQSISSQNESADRESERQVEIQNAENNEDSSISEKSIQEPSTPISNNKKKQSLQRKISEVSENDNEDEIESSLEQEKSISHRKSQRSSKQRIIENSLSDDVKEKQRMSNTKSNGSIKQRTTRKTLSVHEDEEHSESEEDTQNDTAEETPEFSEHKQTQSDLSTDKDQTNEPEQSSKLIKNRRTEELSASHRNEEQESDKENDEAEKFESLKNRQTQQNSLIDGDEDERELESIKEKKNVTEEIQESIEQRKLSMKSISRKLFSGNLEDRSSPMTESSEKSRESNRRVETIDPSAYELPSRTRSNSYSESDTEDVHENLVIADDEPMQSITDNNTNLFGPSTNVHTPLPSTSTNQRSKSLKKSGPLQINTLDRYLLNPMSKLRRSEDVQLSQEQLQALGDKLKKIKEQTDKITEKEVKRVHEKTVKIQSSSEIKPKVRNNLKNKNKTPQKPVNKAYVVDGIVYKQPKLPRPQKWATNRLYKFLWKKMEPKYNLDTRRKSEKFVQYLSDVVKVIKRRKNFGNYEEDLNELIKKMAQLGIIETRMDFHNFCFDFLPYEFRVKVTPMLMPGNVTNIPFDPDILTTPIISKQ